MSTYDPYLEPSEDNTPPQQRQQGPSPIVRKNAAGDVDYVLYPGQPQKGTNGLAVASLVLGIVWAFWIGSALAIIFGHTALGQIKTKGQEGKGLAIAGLVLGYVGAATFALFVALPLLLAALGASE